MNAWPPRHALHGLPARYTRYRATHLVVAPHRAARRHADHLNTHTIERLALPHSGARFRLRTRVYSVIFATPSSSSDDDGDSMRVCAASIDTAFAPIANGTARRHLSIMPRHLVISLWRCIATAVLSGMFGRWMVTA